MGDVNRGGKENALQEVLRLTKAFEAEMCPEGSGKVVKLSIEPDGSGAIEYGDRAFRDPVLKFASCRELKKFLKAGMPERLLMLAYAAYDSTVQIVVEEE